MSKLFFASAPPQAELQPPPPKETCTHVRHLLVNITGNRASWDHLGGDNGPMWHINPEQAATVFGGGSDMADTTDRLSRALIKRVTVLEYNSNIDETVGVHIEGIPPRSLTRTATGRPCGPQAAGA